MHVVAQMKDIYSEQTWEILDLKGKIPAEPEFDSYYSFAIDDTTIWVFYRTKDILVYDVTNGYKEMRKIPEPPSFGPSLEYVCMTHIDDNTIFVSMVNDSNIVTIFLYDKVADKFTPQESITCKY